MTGAPEEGPGWRVCFSSLRKVFFWAFSACRSWRARSLARLVNVVRELPAMEDPPVGCYRNGTPGLPQGPRFVRTYANWTFSACNPLGPVTTLNCTAWP